MNPEEIPRLLAQIALADPRVRREDPVELRAQIAMWAGILVDVPYDYAITAAQKHYAQSNWPILPADIATRWRAVVRDRMNRDIDPAPPVDPDNEQAYRAQLVARRQAVANGAVRPVQALPAAERDDVAAMRQQGDLKAFIQQGMRDAAAENARRKALVRRHPDLQDRLEKLPGQRQWSGYIAPDTWNGKPNDSPIRVQLLAIVAEAEAREAGR